MAFGPDGALWVGDVGWELWETVHRVTAGYNGGWSRLEGPQIIRGSIEPPTPVGEPIVAVPHSEFASLTGGVFAGESGLPWLSGAYVYGDFETGRKMFGAAACFACHRYGNAGGMNGPDLTGAGGRYSPRDLLDQIGRPFDVATPGRRRHGPRDAAQDLEAESGQDFRDPVIVQHQAGERCDTGRIEGKGGRIGGGLPRHHDLRRLAAA
jgi:hypothetical protein